MRRVVGDGRRLVGDVRERPALAVGLEAQDQRLQRVGVRPGQLTLAGARGELVKQHGFAGPLAGCGAVGVGGVDRG